MRITNLGAIKHHTVNGVIYFDGEESQRVVVEALARSRKTTEIHESSEIAEPSLGPGWVRVAVPTPVERAQYDAFRAMGFTEAEAAIASSQTELHKSINDGVEDFRKLLLG